MKKTKNISKYDLDWQIVRAFVKGPDTTYQRKLNDADEFFKKNPSKENWERVTNWLEGLLLGYKGMGRRNTLYSQNAYRAIEEVLKEYKAIDINNLPSVESTNDFSKYTFDQRYTLWVDLFKRTKAWAKKGYVHQEQLEFCEQLSKSFIAEELAVMSVWYNKEAFDEIISHARTIPNTHKFLF